MPMDMADVPVKQKIYGMEFRLLEVLVPYGTISENMQFFVEVRHDSPAGMEGWCKVVFTIDRDSSVPTDKYPKLKSAYIRGEDIGPCCAYTSTKEMAIEVCKHYRTQYREKAKMDWLEAKNNKRAYTIIIPLTNKDLEEGS